ncbi:hypothetical protein DASC09_027190 [Saccharomycopsis crataegensis]|uniref:Swiss Army Knife RNA repair protein HAD domain-containing protein n=1 Tax=Saccharomycopsis crataegensis TaxID=43959 RepID=A0AAV5QL06_9ASCO|nr:hypothetical protein DASC09_027190 [Saccharomycopsis crataegensis]
MNQPNNYVTPYINDDNDHHHHDNSKTNAGVPSLPPIPVVSQPTTTSYHRLPVQQAPLVYSQTSLGYSESHLPPANSSANIFPDDIYELPLGQKLSDFEELHIYNFDSLFISPRPNPKLLSRGTLKSLYSGFNFPEDKSLDGGYPVPMIGKKMMYNNVFGWWNEPMFFKGLLAKGSSSSTSLETTWKELVKNGFYGFFREDLIGAILRNTDIVNWETYKSKVKNIVICDRPNERFVPLVKEILQSRTGLGDMISVVMFKKNIGQSNYSFKNKILIQELTGNKNIKAISIYDDIKGIKTYQDLIIEGNYSSSLIPTYVEIISPVYYMHPVRERYLLEQFINANNTRILTRNLQEQYSLIRLRKSFFKTGYIISDESKELLVQSFGKLCNMFPSQTKDHHYYDPSLVNSQISSKLEVQLNIIEISKSKVGDKRLEQIGGFGGTFTWEVAAVGSIQNIAYFAALKPQRYFPRMGFHPPPNFTPFATMYEVPVLVISCVPSFVVTSNIPSKIDNWEPINFPLEITSTLGFVEMFGIVKLGGKKIKAYKHGWNE